MRLPYYVFRPLADLDLTALQRERRDVTEYIARIKRFRAIHKNNRQLLSHDRQEINTRERQANRYLSECMSSIKQLTRGWDGARWKAHFASLKAQKPAIAAKSFTKAKAASKGVSLSPEEQAAWAAAHGFSVKGAE